MGNSIFTKAAQFIRDRRDNRRWQAAVSCLAILVVSGTIWALVRQGQALNGSSEDVLDCKYEVHEHSADCYEDGELVCGKVEYVVHTHDDSCYDKDGGLACLLPEEKGHKHDASCFEIEEILACGLEESAASVYYMGESSDEQEGSFVSYAQGTRQLVCGEEEHIHGNSCYTTSSDADLICGQVEEKGHFHTDACYATNKDLTCGQVESEEHAHSDDCYMISTDLICGEAEKEGHFHTVDCYATSESTDLTCGLAEHTHTDGCYESPARSEDSVQNRPAAGHTHSDDCYLMARILTCTQEGVHTHDKGCYQDGILVCTAPEVIRLERHVHGPECFGEGEDEEYIKTYMNDDIKVTAVYRTSAGIPENATLDVEMITDQDDERYADRLAEIEEKYGELTDEGLAMLLGFGFQTTDEWFLPRDTVSLTVQFLNDNIYAEGDEVTVVCFDEDGISLIAGTDIDEDGVTTFDVDNLTELAFITYVENARELVYEGEDYIVTVALEEDSAVPEDAELVVEKITQKDEDSELYLEYHERLDEAGVLEDNEIAAMILDMKVYVDGQEIVLDETMEVTVQFLNRETYFEEDAVKAAYITAEDIVLLEASNIDNELSTKFTVDELAAAAFIVDGEIRTMTAKGEDYIVTVRFSPKAMIPEDAVFTAKRITRENDPEHFAAREEQVQNEVDDELIVLDALFDIGFYDTDGEKIEPKSAVDVKIQLLDRSDDKNDADKSDSVKIIHFAVDEESAEESVVIIKDADVTNEGDGSLSTTFQTESFSDFAYAVIDPSEAEGMGSDSEESEAELPETGESESEELPITYGSQSNSNIAVMSVSDGLIDDEESFVRDVNRALKSENNIVKLDGDFEYTGKVNSSVANGALWIAGKIIIDMNGHTINVTGKDTTVFRIYSSGEVTIIDSSEGSAKSLEKSNPRSEDRSIGKDYQRNLQKNRGIPTINLDGNSNKLESISFDVTESKVDLQTGKSDETTYTYTLKGHGAIVGNSSNAAPLVDIPAKSTGKLTLDGGVVLARNSGRAIKVGDVQSNSTITAIYGTVNLRDCYLIGNGKAIADIKDDGGAIYCANGTLNIGDETNSNVIPIISGNEAMRGGGAYTQVAIVNVYGGYVTNNRSRQNDMMGYGNGKDKNIDKNTNNSDGYNYNKDLGGGGGLLILESTFTMSGGYITGNVSERGGAGIAFDSRAGKYSKADIIARIKGGNISSNFCVSSERGGRTTDEGTAGEGAGIAIYGYNSEHNVKLTIGAKEGEVSNNYVYINNNWLTGSSDWGGGGLFVSAKAVADIYEAVISDNSAEGFGGGLSGCPTGEILTSDSAAAISVKGIAIFDNKADGKASSGTGASDGKAKSFDRFLIGDASGKAFSNDSKNVFIKYHDLFFRENGKYYQDCFTAKNMSLYNIMLGGGYENWAGMTDEMRIDGGEDFIASKEVLGLTAFPKHDDSSIDAIEAAREAAHVFITGNHSSVHGGGIMCNGVLSLGELPKEVERIAKLDLTANKALVIKDTNTKISMEEGQFEFGIYKEVEKTDKNPDGLTLVSTATNDKDGNIKFDTLNFNLAKDFGQGLAANTIKTYTYYIKEVPKEEDEEDTANIGIEMDSTVYTLVVTVKKVKESGVLGKATSVTVYKDTITSVVLKKGNATIKTYSNVTDSTIKLVGNTSSGPLFTNKKPKTIDITVQKEWHKSIAYSEGDYVKVTLYRYQGNKENKAQVGEPVELNDGNSWKYTWNNLSGEYSYTVKETEVKINGKVVENPDYLYTQEIGWDDKSNTVTITNVPKKFDIEITKKDSNNQILHGYVKFKIFEDSSNELIKFVHAASDTSTKSGVYTVWDGKNSSVKQGDEVVTEVYIENISDPDGKLMISGLSSGVKYRIEETEAPIGYRMILPHTIEVTVDESKTDAPSFEIEVKCKENECEQIKDQHITYSDVDGKVLLQLTIVDPDDVYELPETGGIGNGNVYIGIVAAMLFFGTSAVIYTFSQRRKGELGR